MQINAVQIIARFFDRNGKPRFVNQAPQIAAGQGKGDRHFVLRHSRKILARQRLQGKTGAPGGQIQPPTGFIHRQFDLRPVGQFAHNIVKHMRRCGYRAGLGHFRLNPFTHLDFQIGRGEAKHAIIRLQQHIRQNRDGIAPFDNALHMIERF